MLRPTVEKVLEGSSYPSLRSAAAGPFWEPAWLVLGRLDVTPMALQVWICSAFSPRPLGLRGQPQKKKQAGAFQGSPQHLTLQMAPRLKSWQGPGPLLEGEGLTRKGTEDRGGSWASVRKRGSGEGGDKQEKQPRAEWQAG